ncbi:MAG: MBOAT family O-acyltransferase [Candidatus Uhrbacteria bacterium]|nr:MBOAT family O-acyltransferase [Candidatus Uhrbacteria bacterium]
MEINKIFLIAIAALGIYWISPQKQRNGVLLLASFILYANIHIRFAILLFVSCAIDYALSIAIQRTEDKTRRRLFLILGICSNIGIWFFFKYFIDFLLFLFPNVHGLTYLILPLGLSFYTFHKLSYLVDVYKRKAVPPYFSDYLLYVTYFPKLISGPIERIGPFLSQLSREKNIRNVDLKGSFYLIIWGLFKKFVISASLVVVISQILSIKEHSLTQILLLGYFALLNIYTDFSGYTDIVRGISKLFCIELSINFDFPFFTKNPLEHFKKWHITLMTWMRDYIYMPLFVHFSSKKIIYGIKNPRLRFGIPAIVALFLTFLVYGFWHSDRHYLLIGVLAFFVICVFIVFEQLCGRWFVQKRRVVNNAIDYARMAINFHVIALLSFTSVVPIGENVSFVRSAFFHTGLWIFKYISLQVLLLLVFFVVYEFLQYIRRDALFIIKKNFIVQIMFYLILFFLFINTGEIQNTGFIYFQF